MGKLETDSATLHFVTCACVLHRGWILGLVGWWSGVCGSDIVILPCLVEICDWHFAGARQSGVSCILFSWNQLSESESGNVTQGKDQKSGCRLTRLERTKTHAVSKNGEGVSRGDSVHFGKQWTDNAEIRQTGDAFDQLWSPGPQRRACIRYLLVYLLRSIIPLLCLYHYRQPDAI